MSSMEVSLRKYRQSKHDGEHIWKGRQKGSRADMLLSSLKSLKMSPLIRDNDPNSLAWKRRPFVVWAHLPGCQNPVLQLPPAPLQTYQPTLPTSDLHHAPSLWGKPSSNCLSRESSIISLCEAFPESSKQSWPPLCNDWASCTALSLPFSHCSAQLTLEHRGLNAMGLLTCGFFSQ